MRVRIVSLFLVFLFLALPAPVLAVERPSASATFTPGGAAKPAAQGFVAGTRGVACGDAYYCIESDGVYRFDGGQKSLAYAGSFDVNGSIVTDGAEMYVTQQRQAGVNVVRIDLVTGETAFAAGFGPEFNSLAGVIDGALYALCWDAENDWEGPNLYRVDLASGESQLLSSHLGGAQLWKNNLILHGFRTDVGPSVYLTLDGAGNTGVICQTALGGQGLEDGIYYWACAPDEDGIWDWMELRQIGA